MWRLMRPAKMHQPASGLDRAAGPFSTPGQASVQASQATYRDPPNFQPRLYCVLPFPRTRTRPVQRHWQRIPDGRRGCPALHSSLSGLSGAFSRRPTIVHRTATHPLPDPLGLSHLSLPQYLKTPLFLDSQTHRRSVPPSHACISHQRSSNSPLSFFRLSATATPPSYW